MSDTRSIDSDEGGRENRKFAENLNDRNPSSQLSFHSSNSRRTVGQKCKNLLGECYSPVGAKSFTFSHPFAVEGENLHQDVSIDNSVGPGCVKKGDVNYHLSDLSLQDCGLLDEKTKSLLDIHPLPSKCQNVNLLHRKGIYVLVPLSGYTLPATANFIGGTHPFSINLTDLTVEKVLLSKGLRVFQTSPVMKLEPFGTEFCEWGPVIVIIPLSIVVCEQDEIICLHTNDPLKSNWKILAHSTISNDRSQLIVKIYRLNYITVVIRQKLPIMTKQIRCKSGGQIIHPDLNVIVDFPRGSIEEDIEVSVKVCLDREFSTTIFFDTIEESVSDYVKCMASPAIGVEPHGVNFGQPVQITLPIPEYDKIMKITGGTAVLKILYSDTDNEGEKLDWKFLDSPFELKQIDLRSGETMACAKLSISHFSFFRAVWDLISNSFYQARVAMYYFSANSVMRVQAYCEVFEDGRFGLEVHCFRSEKKFPQNQVYKFLVGESHEKLVTNGQLVIRLKSSHFVADEKAGEEADLVKEEDFRGWDFQKQFSCKFKENRKIERGPFGKVVISKKNSENSETLFEFNINLNVKSCITDEKTSTARNKWVRLPLAELAKSFSVTEGENWKILATHLGFNKNEIKKIFEEAADPLMAVNDKFCQKGGTAETFINAFYSVQWDLKINDMLTPSSSHASQTHSSGRGVTAKGMLLDEIEFTIHNQH